MNDENEMKYAVLVSISNREGENMQQKKGIGDDQKKKYETWRKKK